MFHASSQMHLCATRAQKGLLTFTAQSIIDDPISAIELMRRAQLHPNWQFFVTPPVLRTAMHTLRGYMDDWQ